MSIQLHLLNLWLRYVTRPRLQRTMTPHGMRVGLEHAASMLPAVEADVTFSEDIASFPSVDNPAGEPRLRVIDASPRKGPPAPRQLCVHPAGNAPTRAILYLHGGAYLAGSPETHRSILDPLSTEARALVAAPDYRLAPEHPFPAALEDAIASYVALLENGWPAGRIALAGESAGGGLALAALHCIEQRGMPRPGAVVAFSPFADLSLSGRSLHKFAKRESMLPVSRMPEVVDAYLAGADPRDPRASPIFAQFMAPPPALIQAGRTEALRDDAVRTAEALRQAGGDVRLELWPGVPHAFQFFSAILPEARKAIASASAFIRTVIPDEDRDTNTPLEGDEAREAC